MLRKISVFMAFTAGMIILSILPGCGVLQKLGIIEDKSKTQPVSSILLSEEDAAKLSDKVGLRLYFGNPDQTKLSLQVRYIPVTEAKKGINTLATAVVKELLNGPGDKTLVKSVIPEGTKLMEAVKVDGGIAVVNLSREFVDKHPGGKTESQLTIYSIANSLTELKEVIKVKFLIEGKEQKDFKGVFQFDAAFPRAASLISVEVLVPNDGKAGDGKVTGDAVGEGVDEGSGDGLPAVNPDDMEEELLE